MKRRRGWVGMSGEDCRSSFGAANRATKKIERWADPWPYLAAIYLGDTTRIKYKLASKVGGTLERRGGQGGTCGGALSLRTGRRFGGE
jgi:hypothetical protein